MHKIGFSFFLFILMINSWYYAYSQDMVVYDEQKKLEIFFKYNPYDADTILPNFFINKLSESQKKIRSYFKYSISLNINSKLIKKSDKEYQISLHIDKLKYSGDFIYKGFNFQKQCLPKDVFLSYNILERNSNFKQKRIIKLSIFESENIIFDSIFGDSTANGSFTIIDEKLNYIFDIQQKNEFSKAINNIENYYSDGIKIKKAEDELKLLDVNDIDKIQLQSIDIKYIKKHFDRINISKYASSLSLETTDPAGIFLQYKKVRIRVDSLYELFRSKLKVLDTLYYAKAIEYFLDSNSTKGREYLDKSLKFNPEYIPSIYKLAELEYQNNNLIIAKNLLNKILMVSSTNIKANTLARLTYEALLKEGISLNSEERYNEGLIVLEKAKEFCTKNMHILSCDSIQEPAIKKSKFGMYSSYLSIAGASMQRGRFDMTEDYINTAYDYKNRYPEAIENTKEADALYTLLITQYLRMSIEEAATYHNRKSISLLNYADSLSKAHQLADAISFVAETKLKIKDKDYTHSKIAKASIINSKLINEKTYSNVKIDFISKEQIAQNSYQLHLDKAMVYYQYRRYALAYPEFQEAKIISQQNNIQPHDSLETYLKKSAKDVIIKQISNASLHAWAGRFKTAKLIENNAQKKIAQNNLQNDKDIILKLEKLNEDLKKQADTKQSKIFDANMQKTKKSLEFNDYLSVSKYCNIAISIAKSNPQIPLNIGFPESILEKYKLNIKYQQQIENVKSLCANNKHLEAIEEFKAAQKSFNTINEKKTKISRISLNTLAQECNNTEFYNNAINFLNKTNLIEKAYLLWKSSIENGIIISDNAAINCMIKLGNADKVKYPNAKRKQLFNLRFNNSEPFKKYRKYYYKGLKQKNI